jgi:hypothetical protein
VEAVAVVIKQQEHALLVVALAELFIQMLLLFLQLQL